MNRKTLSLVLLAVAIGGATRAEEWSEFKVKREEVFEFARKPIVTRRGDAVTVSFTVKGYCDAGLRVPKILDYGGMAGLEYGALSPQKVREAEDELLKLTAGG